VLTTLPEAVEALVGDGDTVAPRAFTHLIPHAAGHELIRQGLRELILIRMRMVATRATVRSTRVSAVVTDLGVLEQRDGELTHVAVHPGVSADEVRAETGWELRVGDELSITELPDDAELRTLRALAVRGHG
jgi:hypothetical protein